MAAAAARAGIRSVVLIPDNLELGKVVTSAVYGTTLVGIHGNYDDVNRLCSEVASSRDWGFVNVNLRPYYAEGSKTVGFEIAEQLGWRLPQQVVIPVASGSGPDAGDARPAVATDPAGGRQPEAAAMAARIAALFDGRQLAASHAHRLAGRLRDLDARAVCLCEARGER